MRRNNPAILLSFLLLTACNSNTTIIKSIPSVNPAQSTSETTQLKIEKVKSICFIDKDGAKIKAVSIKYPEAVQKSSIDIDTYHLFVYSPTALDYIGDGKIGEIKNIYVSDKEDEYSGTEESGLYVILEVFTDYLCATETVYSKGIGVSLQQSKDIQTIAGKTIPKSEDRYSNRLGSKSYDFILDDISGFKYYSDTPGEFQTDGKAFHQGHCFSSIDGTYQDVSLAYALFLPKDYHEDGNYALVTVQNPAATAGTHPFVSVLQTRSPAYYASEEAQQLVKEKHGLDGLIVLVPTIMERVDDNCGTPSEYEAIVHLWDYIIDTYHVNRDYVYGTGQSVGGMILLETNKNRDNFFAGILLYEDQWAQNYYMDTTFQRDMVSNQKVAEKAERHYPRVDSYITYDYHYSESGEKVYENHDPSNFYYLVSDDNILINSGDDVYLSVDTWREMKYLYQDLCGYDLENIIIDSRKSQQEIDEEIKTYLNRKNTQNINWILYQNGHGGYTDRKSDETYRWLLFQDRKEEMKRQKLDLNKPFEIAESQIQTEERKLHYTTKDGNPIYYQTGKKGAGTKFYNTSWLNLSTIADNAPGWLPDGMSWEKGVKEAKIISGSVLDESTIAIQFDQDMRDLTCALKGDNVIDNVTKEPRENDFVLFDPFRFYDSEGNVLEVSISNLYMNTLPEKSDNQPKLSGEGEYLVITLNKQITKSIVSFSQIATLHTDVCISSPSAKQYYLSHK